MTLGRVHNWSLLSMSVVSKFVEADFYMRLKAGRSIVLRYQEQIVSRRVLGEEFC